MSFFDRARAVVRSLLPAVSSATHPFLKGDRDEGDTGRGMRSPFRQSAWVRRAITVLSDPLAQSPIRFTVPTANGNREYRDPDLEAFWERPAHGPEGRLTRSDAIAATVGWLQLRGHCYWIFGDTWAAGSLTPARAREPFLITSPDRVRVQWDSADKGRVIGYWFRTASGREYALPVEQVHHIRYWNPDDEIEGAAPYEAARTPAEGDHYAGRFMRSLMMGNGDRGPIISPKDKEQIFSPEQVDQMKAALQEKRRANLKGEFRPLFLGGAVDVQDPSVSSADADFVANRVENRTEVFAAFGIPASLAEPRATYSIGAASDYYQLIETSCKPLGNKLAAHIDAVSIRLVDMSGEGMDRIHSAFDFSGLHVVQQVQQDKIKSWKDLLSGGMPPFQAAAFLGLPLPRFEGDDKGTLAFNLTPVADVFAAKVEPEPTPAALEDSDPAKKLLLLMRGPSPVEPLRRALTATVVPTPTGAPILGNATDADREAAQAALWRRLIGTRLSAEKATEKAVSRALMVARKECLGNIGSRAVQRAESADDEADPRHAEDVIFKFDVFLNTLKSGLAKLFRVNVNVGGQEARSALGINDPADNPWTMPAQDVLKALEIRSNFIQGSATEIFEEIKTTLAEGFTAGDTTDELADRVREAFNGISKGRAKTIAITETGAAYETGRRAAALDAGAKSMKWLSARDSRVRPDHVEADGQHVGIEDFFAVGGEVCRHPCGEGLSAKQACNCRCIAQYLTTPAPAAK